MLGEAWGAIEWIVYCHEHGVDGMAYGMYDEIPRVVCSRQDIYVESPL